MEIVYVIIVTFNGEKYIRKCLSSLKFWKNVKVLVVDNNSCDNTIEIIERGYPEIILIKSPKNIGFGRANNIGIKYAMDKNADFVFLLNQDAYVRKDTIEILIRTSQQNPKYGVLSPIHLTGDGKRLDFHFSTYISSTKCPNLLNDLYLNHSSMKDIYMCSFINAAAWLITKKCVLQIGGFDPIFPHYGEDMDYLNRLNFHKLFIGICPMTTINHDRGFTNKLSSKSYYIQKLLFIKVILKDINRPFSKVISVVFVTLIVEMVSNFLNFQIKKSFISILLFLKTFLLIRKISINRKLSKKGYSSFISFL